MTKRKRRKTQQSKKFISSIPDTANPIRFLIFLIVGVILLGIFMYFLIIHIND
jgi:hypothetical protein